MPSASEPSLSAARRALADFARRSPATQADIDAVMRALTEHDDWYVPATYAARAWDQTAFDQMLVFGEPAPTQTLMVFTDRESAAHADGQPIGAYGGGVPGRTLLGSLVGGFTAFTVNHASPREHQWFISEAGFEIARIWAAAVTAERALARLGGGPLPVADLRAHDWYHLLYDRADKDVARFRIPAVDGELAMAFTAPDRVSDFLADLSPAQRASAAFPQVRGPVLFDMMVDGGVAGLVVNGGSDHQTVLYRADLENLAVVGRVG